MEDWVLSIVFHYPHNRLAIGWEFINADEKENYYTINQKYNQINKTGKVVATNSARKIKSILLM